MKRTELGRSGIEVSAWCLGTMTWGRQTDAAAAHTQIDTALDHGIDFMDAAEMYPVNPVMAETVGDTEAIIGDWIERTGRRGDIVLATKCTGPSELVRDGAPITPKTLRAALDGSLQRLKTDHVDLYQLHWPNRGSYHFRKIWGYDPTAQDTSEVKDNIAAVSETLGELVSEGKIRAFGLSNDTAWGVSQWQAARGPRVDAIQNEYSLLCRYFDADLAETCHHEGVTLLAYSPLACGLLTGKYADGRVPEGSRRSINDNLNGRMSAGTEAATQAYLDIAARHGIDPVHMAIAWTAQRPVRTIPIFGATTQGQLAQILGGVDVSLSQAVLDEIEAAHRTHSMPF
ncbi:General stress protein 69 [Rhodobacteraceae bacterium THAF1]|uniref:aldo/keto reductase n=1 Tax=Palleronia sp. THAF1 TaxID=2587842 RepID=UPI000F3ACFDA|nr:aldo/keto reductase [Palleronia sp. THAF1]QFU08106.1 General stress protein 69 [Palleronia sp. THAF1]VDC27972.1 General stress protein 69 [Rhodobacteraceae bacterium THAF1]